MTNFFLPLTSHLRRRRPTDCFTVGEKKGPEIYVYAAPSSNFFRSPGNIYREEQLALSCRFPPRGFGRKQCNVLYCTNLVLHCTGREDGLSGFPGPLSAIPMTPDSAVNIFRHHHYDPIHDGHSQTNTSGHNDSDSTKVAGYSSVCELNGTDPTAWSFQPLGCLQVSSGAASQLGLEFPEWLTLSAGTPYTR